MGPDAVETSSQHRGVGFKPQPYGSGVVLETGGPPPTCRAGSLSCHHPTAVVPQFPPCSSIWGGLICSPWSPRLAGGGVKVSPWVLRGEREVVGCWGTTAVAVGSVLTRQEGCPSGVPFGVDVPEWQPDLRVLQDVLAVPRSQPGGAPATAQRGLGGLYHLLTLSCTPRPNRLSTRSGARLGSGAGPHPGRDAEGEHGAWPRPSAPGTALAPSPGALVPTPTLSTKSHRWGKKMAFPGGLSKCAKQKASAGRGAEPGLGRIRAGQCPGLSPASPAVERQTDIFSPPLLVFGVTKPKAMVKPKDQVCGTCWGSQCLASKASRHPVSPRPGITTSRHHRIPAPRSSVPASRCCAL